MSATKGEGPSPEGGSNGQRVEGERTSRPGDDTPRETPSAKGSDARIQRAPAVGAHGDAGAERNGEEQRSRGALDSVRIDLPVALRNVDTKPETQSSRMRTAMVVASDDGVEWTPKRPAEGDAWTAPEPLAGEGARLDIGLGPVHVRTFRVRGAFAVGIVILVAMALLALLVALFTFAVGVGTALAIGGAIAAAVGLGVARVRRMFGGGARALPRGGPGDDTKLDRGDDQR